ncbi:mastermind-like protein 1 [Oryzias melastigma]|uniref:mastermind-like protein 1 n=1 Tax=Oryzias melastigma TaxID=30732 RepID=UPI000CF83188|nr:mastermind-like protein 1 [Oryzias melastigma]
MERLRRKIELYRQHQINCESRYEKASVERLELERQQTVALHQRCLQTKAKRASKHRQPPPSGDQAGQRAAAAGAEHGENGGTAPEQSRNSTLIALQETVKRKLESAGSPLSREPANGYGEGFPPNKKPSLDNGAPNGALLDSKRGISNLLSFNGTNGGAAGSADGVQEGDLNFQRKEMKQEPEDILPIMPPSVGGNNSLIPDLNLNEQEWKELMEELNFTVPIEDIQDILNNGFEDRKDPLELAPSPTGGGAVEGGPSARGGPSSKGLIPPDLVSVKAEFPSASAAFEQDPHMGSPHVRSTPSGPPHPTSSPVASSASSPALASSQPPPPPRQHHLPPPGPPVSKDLSPAQQLQQLAAQRTQHLHGSLQPQMGAKFHNQGHQSHPPPWTQMVGTPQSPLVGSFGMEKPKSPSTYSQDFNPNAPKQLLMPPQPNKGSPKAGGGYLQRPNGPPRMMNQLSSGSPLSHPQTSGSQVSSQMLNYSNTEPLRHFELPPTAQRPPNTQGKAAILQLVRQQHMKPHGMGFRQHGPHAQDQNNYPAPPHGATNAMTSVSGNNPCAAQPAVNSAGGNHGNAPYLNNQAAVAAALKQQILEQQKKQQILQRQQLMAEQEKRQQDQQLQRHLTRPPPQYQDQSGPPTNQNPFPQQQVGQFPASSQPMGNGSMGVSSSSSRVFSQNQSMMGMTMGQGGGPGTTVAPPTAASQADISLASCGGGGSGAGVDPLYNNLNLQHGLQRQQMGAMSAPYRQSVLGQQHLKPQPNVAMLKQQQLAAARMPGAMQSTMGGGLQAQMQGGQGATWQQQQLATQPASGNASLPPNVFNNPPNAFHMQRVPKMAPAPVPFASSLGGLPMTGMNPGQQMIQTNMAAQQRAPPPAPNMGQPLANQQQAQQQPANQNLSDMVAFGQQVSGRPALQCNQGYQMSRTANQQQQQVSFGYNAAAGSFAAESELVDSLLKGQEWMAELDALLANHQ